MDAKSVLSFWFSERVKPLWFNSTIEFDKEVQKSYEDLWQAAAAGELSGWEESAEGALALVIILDQFPLNMYRDQSASFSTEQAARDVAERAMAWGYDQNMSEEQKLFLYMPFMHSEKPEEQDRAVALFESAGMSDAIKWAKHHRDIVHRFGRFPHRNAALGRECTDEERAYLESEAAFHG